MFAERDGRATAAEFVSCDDDCADGVAGDRFSYNYCDRGVLFDFRDLSLFLVVGTWVQGEPSTKQRQSVDLLGLQLELPIRYGVDAGAAFPST